jgi:hypothetical protein
MKLAILLVGHIRSFKDNSASFIKYLVEPYDPDIFIHTWDTQDIISPRGQIPQSFTGINEKAASLGITVEELLGTNKKADFEPYLKLEPKKIVVERWQDVEQTIKWADDYFTKRLWCDQPILTMSITRKAYVCNQLKKQFEEEHGFKYDIVLKTRPDIIYVKDFIKPELKADGSPNLDIIYTPLNSSFDTISDITAYSSSANMDIYCDLFINLKKVYETARGFNAHTLLQEHLRLNSLPYIIQNTGIELIKYPGAVGLKGIP